jgi:hypothetical protein
MPYHRNVPAINSEDSNAAAEPQLSGQASRPHRACCRLAVELALDVDPLRGKRDITPVWLRRLSLCPAAIWSVGQTKSAHRDQNAFDVISGFLITTFIS